MELTKRNIHMDYLKCKASLQMTLENDVIIPDSRPDAAKLVLDRGNVVIEEVKTTDNHVNVKGKLLFCILYQAEGTGKGCLADMEGAIPFEEVIYMDEIESGDHVEVCGQLEDLSVDLINSRKVSVQSLIHLQAACEEVVDEEITTDLRSEEPVEFRKKTIEAAVLAVKKKDIFRIKEEVEIPGSFPNILSMIWWDISAGTMEFKVLEDKIALQGELRCFFLYRGEGEEEEVCHYETTIPFAGSLELSGVEEGMIPEIRYIMENRELEVRPDFDGQERVITFEECLELQICVYEEEQLDILSDVYGVVKEVSTIEKTGNFKRLLTKSSGKMKLSDHFQADDQAVLQKVLHTACSVQIEEQNVLAGGIEIKGMADVTVFCQSADESSPYEVVKGSIPFSHVLDAVEADEDCVCSVQAFVDQMAASVIDVNEVDVKCVIYFRTNVYKYQNEKIVKDILVSEPDPEKLAALPGIAVYMVKEGESLWDIGKRYYVTVSGLKQMNELGSEEVKAGDKILIVKG